MAFDMYKYDQPKSAKPSGAARKFLRKFRFQCAQIAAQEAEIAGLQPDAGRYGPPINDTLPDQLATEPTEAEPVVAEVAKPKRVRKPKAASVETESA